MLTASDIKSYFPEHTVLVVPLQKLQDKHVNLLVINKNQNIQGKGSVAKNLAFHKIIKNHPK
jgi:hypothetical protein